eukprot:CAMPEP_0167742078 /NCGR_PEP_ID=MMETSP0110_2-20121227/1220_1 /TAXON_ID=629695 /ORGANISM="Gymnochlora sp., Strain CCMP2014" /LENGTH=1481 /DNA_ID=CAMNT_0007626217 /DNA_START=21 /DNA_END=4466 /DNA_ORIENTATION=+
MNTYHDDEASMASDQSSSSDRMEEDVQRTHNMTQGNLNAPNQSSFFSVQDYRRISSRKRNTITRYNPQEEKSVSGSEDESDEEDESDGYAPRSRRKRRNAKTEEERELEQEAYRNRRQQISLRKVQRKSYEEEDSDDFMDEEDRMVARELARKKMEEDEGDVIEQVMDHKDEEEGSRKYLIKWKGSAHVHNTWVEENQVAMLKGFKKLQNYQKKQKNFEEYLKLLSPDQQEQELIYIEMKRESLKSYMNVARIISQKVAADGNTMYFVLWENLPYDDATWEYQSDLSEKYQNFIDQFLRREDRMKKRKGVAYPSTKQRPFEELKKQPAWLNSLGLELRDYQLNGVNWLAYSWAHNTNAILADEMGLGKTIQCVVFLGILSEMRQLLGPYLIVVPLSTLPAWRKEFAKWTPFLNVVTYVGNPTARSTIRDFEFYQDSGRKASNRKFRMNVLLTTYELVINDKTFLQNVNWKYLMVDEAHRLKDRKSKLYDVLNSFKTANRLLITGTPLQNSMEELWCLLHFLDPKKFSNLEEFTQSYDVNSFTLDAEGRKISKLHEMLKPYLLRRDKKAVLKSLPKKTERILRVQQTHMQKRYYKSVMAKNYKELNKGQHKHSLMNTVMELKKVCNHPFLLPAAWEEFEHSVDSSVHVYSKEYKSEKLNALIKNSGKMILLHKLLKRLYDDGNRVLIFSQMVQMLHILADYLAICGYRFQRLHGSMGSRDRQQAMDNFNKEGSKDFAFLLSTRAGGLGVNLATADTVVIFDSDWNPQNDLQAMARAHRIGQKRHVNIYRFVTKDTVEEKILERAKKKMILDHLVIQQMDTSGRLKLKKKGKKSYNCKDLTKILKFGAKKLFEEDRNGEKEDAKDENDTSAKQNDDHNDENIDLDEILSRAETKEKDADRTEADAFLSNFNVAEFKTNEMATEIKTEVEPDEEAWDSIIPDHLIPEDQKRDEKDAILLITNTRRVRKQVERFSYNTNNTEVEMDEESDEEDEEPIKPKKSSTKAATTKKDLKFIYRALSRFGGTDPGLKWLKRTIWKERKISDEYYKLLVKESEELMKKSVAETRNPSKKEDDSLKKGEAKANEDDKSAVKKKTSKAIFKYRDIKVDAEALVVRARERRILDREFEKFQGQDLRNYRVPAFGLNQVNWKCKPSWQTIQDSMLLLGVYLHGMNAWDEIINDKRLGLKKYLVRAVKPENKDTAVKSEVGKIKSEATALDTKGEETKAEETKVEETKIKEQEEKGKSPSVKVDKKKHGMRIVKNQQLKTRYLRLIQHISSDKPKRKQPTKKVRPGTLADNVSKKQNVEKRGSAKRKSTNADSSKGKSSKPGSKTSNNGSSSKRRRKEDSSGKGKQNGSQKKRKKDPSTSGSEKKKKIRPSPDNRPKSAKIDSDMSKLGKCKNLLKNEQEEAYKSLIRLKKNYVTWVSTSSKKASKHILRLGDGIRKITVKRKSLAKYFWELASMCIGKKGDAAFREVYMKVIKGLK